jgi:hypothetical protein
MTKWGTVDRPYDDDVPEEWAIMLAQHHQAVTAVLDRDARRKAAIASDRELSDDGRRQRLAAAHQAAAAEMEAIANARFGPVGAQHTIQSFKSEGAQARNTLLGSVRAVPEGIDASPEAQREIRTQLYKLRDRDPGAVRQKVIDAVNRGDALTVAAVRNAPQSDPLLSERDQQEIERQQIERLAPGATAAREKRARILDALDLNLDVGRRTIAGNGRIRLR